MDFRRVTRKRHPSSRRGEIYDEPDDFTRGGGLFLPGSSPWGLLVAVVARIVWKLLGKMPHDPSKRKRRPGRMY